MDEFECKKCVFPLGMNKETEDGFHGLFHSLLFAENRDEFNIEVSHQLYLLYK